MMMMMLVMMTLITMVMMTTDDDGEDDHNDDGNDGDDWHATRSIAYNVRFERRFMKITKTIKGSASKHKNYPQGAQNEFPVHTISCLPVFWEISFPLKMKEQLQRN